MEHLMSMTLSQIFGSAIGLVVVISAFIEITPIKINPISHFLKWLGNKINTDINERLTNLEEKVGKIDRKIDEGDAISCRIRILRFGDEIRRDMLHSKENFDQVLSDIDDYEHYCRTHPDFKNNKTVATKEKILKVYSERIDSNNFL